MRKLIVNISEQNRKITDLAVALFLSVVFLSFCIPGLGILSYYRVTYLVLLLSVAMIMFGVIKGNRVALKVHKISFIFGTFLTVYALGCIMVLPKCNYDIVNFVFCFLISIIVISTKFEVENVLCYLVYISVLIIPSYSAYFAYQWEDLNQANMGAVYGALVMCTAGILHFLYYRENHPFWFNLFYIPTVMLTIGIFRFGNRGAFLSFVVLLGLIFLNRKSSIENMSNRKLMAKRRWFVFAFVVLFFVVMEFDTIFIALYDLLNSVIDEMPSFFVKMNRLIRLQDISNGREEVYEAAWSLIKERPLIGYGIRTFLENSKVAEYPHNFFLQLWYEGGILFTVVPTVCIVYALYKLLLSYIEDRNVSVMLIFLFVQVMPRFLLSADIWKDNFFWITVFYILSNWREIRRYKLT